MWRLVPEERRAWHAGVAFWRGRRDINAPRSASSWSIPATNSAIARFPRRRWRRSRSCAATSSARHPIPPRHVLGHSDVAPQRKQDPGRAVSDWPRLARAGIGLWPDFAASPRRARRRRRRACSRRSPTSATTCRAPAARRRTERSRHRLPAPFPPGALRRRSPTTETRATRHRRWRGRAARFDLGGAASRPYLAAPDGRMAAFAVARRGRKVRAPRKHGAG